MFLFGGITGAVDSNEQFWCLDLNSYRWQLLDPKPLNGDQSNFCLTRDEHTACVIGDNMIVFGGFKEGERCNDIFKYSFSGNTWEFIKPA